MRLACGACGHAGGVNQFVGSALLELTLDKLAEGWIEDIGLKSAGGSKDTGELSIFDQQLQQHLLRDDKVQLFLRLDEARQTVKAASELVNSPGLSPTGSRMTSESAARSAALRRTGPAASIG